jgi:aarF domain-containing kinase
MYSNSIIEAVVHLVNRDFVALAELYRRMGFIPANVDTAPIVAALEVRVVQH